MICPICERGKDFRVIKNFEENKEKYECSLCNAILELDDIKYKRINKKVETADPTPDDLEDLFDKKWK